MSTVLTHDNQGNKGHKLWRRILLGLTIFVAVGALFGGGIAVVSPHSAFMGAAVLVPVLQELPLVGPAIDSLFIPGAMLLLFVFVPQTLAAVQLLMRRATQYRAGIICGALLAVFTVVELIFIPNFLSWIYLGFGLIEVLCGVLCLRKGEGGQA